MEFHEKFLLGGDHSDAPTSIEEQSRIDEFTREFAGAVSLSILNLIIIIITQLFSHFVLA